MTKEQDIPEIKRGTMTKKELNILANMMTMCFHAGEKFLHVIQQHLEAEYRASNDYQQIKKHCGKIVADEILKRQATKFLFQDHKLKYGQMIKLADQIKLMMEAITDDIISCKRDGVDYAEAYDSINSDANWLCKFYSLMNNVTNETDWIKIESVIKLYAKGDVVSENILNNFDPTK